MNDQIDISIPVLTEIITDDEKPNSSSSTKSISVGKTLAAAMSTNNAIQAGKSVVTQDRKHDALAPDDLPPPSLDSIGPQLSAEEWKHLEQTIRENVLHQVIARIDFVLEHRVRDSLAEILQTRIDALADDIRSGLKLSLEEVISRAVNQEIAKAKSSR
jgi:hypothetical protein